MRRTLLVLAAACGTFSISAHAANEMLRLELNTADSADNHCRLTFVTQNKNQQAIDTIKLDLVTWHCAAQDGDRHGTGARRQDHGQDICGRRRMQSDRGHHGQRCDRLLAGRTVGLSRRPLALLTRQRRAALQIADAPQETAIARDNRLRRRARALRHSLS